MEVLVASLAVFVGMLVFALGAGWLAHLRSSRVEATLGARALPKDEMPLLLYAAASLVWLSAAVIAVVGLCTPKWARLGRNATWMFFAHLGVAVVGAAACVLVRDAHEAAGPSYLSELVPLLSAACAITALNALAAFAFLWVWVGRRGKRIERGVARSREDASAYRAPSPPAGAAREESPGAWRYALYAGSLLFWPLGIVGLVWLSSPSNARVGASAFRLSLAHLATITFIACGAIPLILSRL